MTKKFVRNQKLHERPGDETAYWNYVQEFYRKSERGEPVQANPDVLPESSGLYSLTEEQLETKKLIDQLLTEASQFLTERQYQVFQLVATGMSKRALARHLGLSEKTVREYFVAATHKLKARFDILREELL